MAAAMGKDGLVSADGSTSNITYIDTWSLTANIGTAEITAYNDDSKAFLSTIKEWTATISGTLDRSDAAQAAILSKFEGSSSSTSLSIRMYDSTKYWAGAGIPVTMTVNSQVADKVTVSVNFQGTGDLSYITT